MRLSRFARAFAITGWAVVLLTGCQAAPHSTPNRTPPASEAELIGPWVDTATTQEAPSGDPPGSPLVVSAIPFSYDGCSKDAVAQTVKLALGWPVGPAVGPPYDTADFVRQPPQGARSPYTPSDLDATLPASAPAPRFSRNGNFITVDPRGRWVYVQRSAAQVEKWGRVTGDLPGCA